LREQTPAAIGPRLTTQNGYARGRQEATEDPVIADIRNFYKVELWTHDNIIERMLFARRPTNAAGAFLSHGNCCHDYATPVCAAPKWRS
jgi:hypothetical protein